MVSKRDERASGSRVDHIRIDGPALWKKLHTNRNATKSWLENDWLPMLQYLGCDCSMKFKKIIADYPPDFSTPEAFFNWGVFVHNLVNEKLGKPLMEHDEAKALWQNKETCDAGEDCCKNGCGKAV